MSPPTTKQKRAAATRRRIVGAAYRLFCANGYDATTMTAIAAEADVAVQTLYFIFGTKAAILGEVLGAAIVGFDQWIKPTEPVDAAQLQKQVLPWWDDFALADDPRLAMTIFVEGAVDVLERVGPLLGALHAASGSPEIDTVRDVAEARRVESYREALRTLQEAHEVLLPHLTLSQATDILLVLLSPDLYHAMTAGRGWTADECKRFLTEVVMAQLLKG